MFRIKVVKYKILYFFEEMNAIYIDKFENCYIPAFAKHLKNMLLISINAKL